MPESLAFPDNPTNHSAMKTSRITKEEGVAAILVDIERNGRARPRRHYAAEWDISPTTVYYWIKEAEQRAGAAVS